LDGLKWIGDFRDPNSKDLLGIKTGSLWGVGYGLQCLLKARKIYKQDGTYLGDFDEKAQNAIRYLVNKATQGTDTCCWEDNIWDTAVICRGLIKSIIEYPDLAAQINVEQICIKSLRYLIKIVNTWKIIRYVQGITDLSQILRTFITAYEIIPSGFDSIQKEIISSTRANIIYDLADEIIHSVEIREDLYNGHKEKFAVWEDDISATADAILSLSKLITSNATQIDQQKAKNLNKILCLAVRFLELEQVDGRWGMEENTSLALRAYVVGSNALGLKRYPEPHIVFKAIRYLCDPKIVFSDGSIAHEMEPTVYMLLALIDVIDKWNLPDKLCCEKPVVELYDYIIWNTPARSTYERVLRMQAQTEADQLKDQNGYLEGRINHFRKQLRTWQTGSYILIVLILAALFAQWLGVGEGRQILIPLINISVYDWQAFLAFLTLFGGIAWFVYDRILHWTNGPS
jgi:hypothetical protein